MSSRKPFSRRKFLTTATLGAGSAGLGLVLPRPLWASSDLAGLDGLSGSVFDLDIAPTPVSIAGRRATATGINGSVPGPLLRWKEGDTVVLNVRNSLHETSSLHWHGLLLPSNMDGVPGLSFDGIAPGETYRYEFAIRQSGTYWYHSHSGFQEQTGVYGPIIIEPAAADPVDYDREFVLLLSDWTFEDPNRIMTNLKVRDDYYNYNRRTLSEFIADAERDSLSAAVDDRLMWGSMRMKAADIADITAATYTYLLNGLDPGQNWTGIFRPGERVRLRLINGSAQTFFNFRIPGLEMTVVQADGQNVRPVTVDEMQIGVAETYDVIVEPKREGAYTLFAETMDRSGFARGTLASKAGIDAPVPELRDPPRVTMRDMGMDHGSMDHNGAHGAVDHSTMDHSSKDHSTMDHSTMDHSTMSGSGMGQPDEEHAGMGHGDTGGGAHHEAKADPAMAGPGMAHSHTGPAGTDPAAANEAAMHSGEEHARHAGHAGEHRPIRHGDAAAAGTHDVGRGSRNDLGLDGPVVHAHRRGPGVANVVANPLSRLNEPGQGLEDVQHRVLRCSQLESLDQNGDERPPGRVVELHLTGNMERYMWSFDGVKYSEVRGPIRFYYGERLRLVLVNDTMMSHPIHLHGMFVELVNGKGRRNPRKHTVVVKPAERLAVDVTADEPGHWAFHCHMLYHMKAGMMRSVMVADDPTVSELQS